MSENTVNKVIQTMGYKGQMVGHGFRSIATTQLYEAGFPEDIVERQMQHIEKNKVKEAYDRSQHLERRTQMMQWWSGFLANEVGENHGI